MLLVLEGTGGAFDLHGGMELPVLCGDGIYRSQVFPGVSVDRSRRRPLRRPAVRIRCVGEGGQIAGAHGVCQKAWLDSRAFKSVQVKAAAASVITCVRSTDGRASFSLAGPLRLGELRTARYSRTRSAARPRLDTSAGRIYLTPVGTARTKESPAAEGDRVPRHARGVVGARPRPVGRQCEPVRPDGRGSIPDHRGRAAKVGGDSTLVLVCGPGGFTACPLLAGWEPRSHRPADWRTLAGLIRATLDGSSGGST